MTSHIKAQCYNSLVRPILDYGSCIWDPSLPCNADIKIRKKIHKRDARFVTGNNTFEHGNTKFNTKNFQISVGLRLFFFQVPTPTALFRTLLLLNFGHFATPYYYSAPTNIDFHMRKKAQGRFSENGTQISFRL